MTSMQVINGRYLGSAGGADRHVPRITAPSSDQGTKTHPHILILAPVPINMPKMHRNSLSALVSEVLTSVTDLLHVVKQTSVIGTF